MGQDLRRRGCFQPMLRCPPGNYCPRYLCPIPAPRGYFAPGRATQAAQCLPGSYTHYEGFEFASHVQLVMNRRRYLQADYLQIRYPTLPPRLHHLQELSHGYVEPVPRSTDESLSYQQPWPCVLCGVPRTTNRSATISRRWSTSLSALARLNWTRAVRGA